MIRGIFSLNQTETYTSLAVSVFSDCCKALQCKTSRVPPKYQEHLKHFYSKDVSLGYLLGDYMHRTFFCTFSSAESGCEDLAAAFLFRENGKPIEEFVFKHKFEKTHPFLMIFVEGTKALVVTCYGSYDFDITILNPGTVCITDYVIHSMRPDDEEAQYILASWHEDFNLYKSTSNALVKNLQSKTMSYPPPSGLGVTLLKVNNRATLTVSDPGCKKIDTRPKIKGPVSSFNYFCIAARKLSVNQWGSEVSKILGSQWNSMSAAEREPFVRMAKEDHDRYTAEVELQNQLLYSNPQVIKQKPHTAYNLFIIQEKQYLFGLQIGEPQTRLGKHGSDRWANMSLAEKELYEVQREVEVVNSSLSSSIML